MNCEAVLELYTDYLESALSDDQRAQVDTHLRGCAKCADDFMFFQSIVAEARTFEPAPVPLSLRSNVRAALSQRQPSWGERLLALLKRPATVSLAGVTACALLVAVAVRHNPPPATPGAVGQRAESPSTPTHDGPAKLPAFADRQAGSGRSNSFEFQSRMPSKKAQPVAPLKDAQESGIKLARRAPAPPVAGENIKMKAAHREALYGRRTEDKPTAKFEGSGSVAKEALAPGLGGGFGAGGGGMGALGGQSSPGNRTLALKGADGLATQGAATPSLGRASEGKAVVTEDRSRDSAALALGKPSGPGQRSATPPRSESRSGGAKRDDLADVRKGTVSAGATNSASSAPATAMRAGAEVTQTLSQSNEREKQTSLNYFAFGREMQLVPVDEESRANYRSLGKSGEGVARYNRQMPNQNQPANLRSQVRPGITVTASVRSLLEVGETATMTAQVQTSLKVIDATIQIEAPNDIEFIHGNSTAKGTVTVWSGNLLPNEAARVAVNFRAMVNGRHLLSIIIRSDERGVLARRTFIVPIGAENQLRQAGAGAAKTKK